MPDRAALEVLREVFLDDAYAAATTTAPAPTILDVGSHVGASALYFHARYPEATIHAFEPDPDNFALLVANTRQVPGVVVHNLAVAGSDGHRTLWQGNESWTSSLEPRSGPRAVPVQAVRLDTVLERLGLETVDLLKLDVEGAEFDVISSCRRLDRYELICAELHLDLVPASIADWRAALGGYETTVEPISAERALLVARRLGAPTVTSPALR